MDGVMTSDWERTEEDKGEKPASGPREVPSNFSAVVAPELSTGPFRVTRSNLTHQLTDPTRPNPIQLATELTV